MELQVSKMQRVIEEQKEEIRELKTKLSEQSMVNSKRSLKHKYGHTENTLVFLTIFKYFLF